MWDMKKYNFKSRVQTIKIFVSYYKGYNDIAMILYEYEQKCSTVAHVGSQSTPMKAFIQIMRRKDLRQQLQYDNTELIGIDMANALTNLM